MIRPQRKRRGIALVMALVLMATLAVIFSVGAVQIVAQRRQCEQRHRQLQADWLARAGLELAAARLLDSPSAFTEEKKDLFPDATVHIVIEKGAADLYSVTVEADLGAADEKHMVRTAQGQFQRLEKGGAVELKAVPPMSEK